MKIKKEVQDICLKLRRTVIGTHEWVAICDTLKEKYGFTAYTIIGLYEDPPAIEIDDNYHLVCD